MPDLVTKRLVELVFAPPDQVATWLTRIGLAATKQADDVILIRNPHLNFTTVFYEQTDPMARGVCLAGAVAGQFWPVAFPALLDRPGRRRQEERQKAATTGPGPRPRPKDGATKPAPPTKTKLCND